MSVRPESSARLASPGTWARYQIALRAFHRAADVLQAAGVPVVPVKGLALARWIYDDVGERLFADVDLLVPRGAWRAARDAVSPLGPVLYESAELGELLVMIDGIEVELHAEMGRRELTDLSVDEVIERASIDAETFGLPVRRLDDVDHLLLVAMNAVKDGFAFARPHVPSDLDRLLARVDASAVAERARAAGFLTGLHCTAEWMAETRDSRRWADLLASLGVPKRRLHVRAVRALRRLDRPPRTLSVVLGIASHDRTAPRVRAVGRIVRRGATRLLGRTPP